MALWNKPKPLNEMDLFKNREQSDAENRSQDEPKPAQKSESNWVSEYMAEINEIAVDNNMKPIINGSGNYSIVAIAEFIKILDDANNRLSNSRNHYRTRYGNLEAKYREMEQYIKDTGNDEGYERWKQAQKHGRPRKTIDWERYDLLLRAGLTQKQIAEHLGVSANTLRKLMRER